MAVKKPRRPSVEYSASVVDAIIERVEAGEPLAQVCRDEGMPSPRAWYTWCDDRPELDSRFARARKLGHDAIAAEALRIADTPLIGEEETEKPDGSVEKKRGDMLGHRKLQIETRLKLLAKWDRRYADKLGIGGDEDAPPIKTDGTLSITPQDAYLKMLGRG